MSRLTLIEWLRAQQEAVLVGLLRERPDLATPPPADTAVLAMRAGTPSSVARAAEGLDTFTLAVLDALILADADSAPVPEAVVERTLGAAAKPERVRAALDELRRLAIAWGTEEISLVTTAREVSGPFPGGLGRPSPALDEVDVPALLAELPEQERRLLTT